MKVRRDYVSAAAVAVVALVLGVYASHDVQVSPDSVGYAEVAQRWSSGQGLTRSRALFWSTSAGVEVQPFTMQPPLYPMLLASMGNVGPGRLWPGRVLNTLGLLIAALSAFYTARRFGGAWAGLAAGLLVCASVPLLAICHWLWTDGLFTGLFALTVALLLRSRDAESKWGWQLGAGLSAALAFSLRYAGVALLPLFAWEWLTTRVQDRKLARVDGALLAPVPLLLAIVVLFGRNVLLTHSLTGLTLPVPMAVHPVILAKSTLGVLRDLLALIGAQFGIWGSGLKSLLKVGFLFALLAPPIGIGLAQAVRLKQWERFRSSGLDLVGGAGAAYFILLAYVERTNVNLPEDRYVVPLVPLLLSGFVVCILWGWGSLRWPRAGRLLRWVAALSVCGLVLYQGREAVHSWPELRAPGEPDVRLTQTCHWMTANLPAGAVVASNDSPGLQFYARWPAMALPRLESGFRLLPEDMEEALPNRMAQVGAVHLVLLCGPEGLSDADYGPFVGALSRRQPLGDRFEKLYECADGVVYRLRAPAE